MEIIGKVVIIALSILGVISGVKLWIEGFPDFGMVAIAAGVGLAGFVYWELR